MESPKSQQPMGKDDTEFGIAEDRLAETSVGTMEEDTIMTTDANFLTLLTVLEKVLILTVDGRTLLGTLLSTDQLTNLVLTNTIERIIRTPDDPEPSSEIEHGLYLIRGDNVVVCGEVDEAIDNDIDWTKVKGEVVRGTKNV
ncbi:hypothetical protein MPDQ_001749 [Monascus purpureus]|uniref:LSM2-LSM8 complex subunit LSM8 n=1 Tax=Monascus purpureus TaxID=5098 RepID=A0A507R0U7_MONPU|nr:hypothetical protein MPDQ_001749 [Monascus purpureus]